MKKITTLLLLIAVSLSTFATDNEETFKDGTVFFHRPNSNFIYVETTNQLVTNTLYNRADLIEYHDEVDTTTNQKVRVFKLKNDNIIALHNKVQTFANFNR